MKKIICAHNPLTGGRHLGQYFGSMQDLALLQKTNECYVVLDDWMDFLNFPSQREHLLKRTLWVVNEFILSGIDVNTTKFIATSLITKELSSLIIKLGEYVDFDIASVTYKNSFLGSLTFSERKEIGLPDRTSLTEFFYNTYSPCAFTLGLGVDEFLGGDDVANYTNHINHIVGNFRKYNSEDLKEVTFYRSKTPFVMAYDGSFMNQHNGLFISDDKKDIEDYVNKISNPEVIDQWLTALGNDISRSQNLPHVERQKILINELLNHLSRFSESRYSNGELLNILISGSNYASEKLVEFIDNIDSSANYPRLDRLK